MASGEFTLDVTFLIDPLSSVMLLVITGIGSLIHIYSTAYMHDESRQRVRALLLVPEPVRRVHAGAGARLELPGAVRGLGRRRPLLVPADRVLVQEEVGGRRRQEGVRRQPHRRLRVPARHVRAVRDVRHPRVRGVAAKVAAMPPEAAFGVLSRRDAAAVRRRHRQVRADSALRLAAGRDGRPDAGVGPHPRRDDGHRRRLHDWPQCGALQPRAGDADDRGGDRRGDRADGRHDRPGAERHQARAGVLDGVAARA